jgi:hypothetical protein
MKTTTWRTFGVFLLWCICTLIIAGCAYLNKKPRTEEKQATVADGQTKPGLVKGSASVQEKKVRPVHTQNDYFHTVRWHGETLAYIAKWYTGNLHNWRVLAKANPNLKPNRIYKGNQIVIPERILITRKPLPKNFRAVLPKTTKKTSSKASHQSKDEDGLPLFGPKAH